VDGLKEEVSAVEVFAGPETVRTSMGEVTPSRLAVMLLVPVPTPVAKPVALIVATPVAAEFQVTCVVMSIKEPSENIPVAVNCCVSPLAIEGFAGVTAMFCRVAAVTVTGLEVPVIVAATVSVPVIVWVPTVFKVTESVLVPLISVTFAGSTAAPSVLVKCTVPV
jgi:hypothetical protein